MSEALEVRAELMKISRLLRADSSQELDYLESLGATELRQLRDQITDVLFDAHAGAVGRLVAASRLLPVSVVAQIGERVFGPSLSARVAGRLDPDRAVEMAEKLPTPFLADIAIELDPRRASEVIARIPADRIAAITRELIGREEYVAMGRFVGYLPAASIQAAVGAMDPRALINVAFVLENKARLPEVVDQLEPGRFEEMIRLAANSALAEEAFGLLEYLNEAQRAAVMRMPEVRGRLSA
jgi:hypothetical protein